MIVFCQSIHQGILRSIVFAVLSFIQRCLQNRSIWFDVSCGFLCSFMRLLDVLYALMSYANCEIMAALVQRSVLVWILVLDGLSFGGRMYAT